MLTLSRLRQRDPNLLGDVWAVADTGPLSFSPSFVGASSAAAASSATSVLSTSFSSAFIDLKLLGRPLPGAAGLVSLPSLSPTQPPLLSRSDLRLPTPTPCLVPPSIHDSGRRYRYDRRVHDSSALNLLSTGADVNVQQTHSSAPCHHFQQSGVHCVEVGWLVRLVVLLYHRHCCLCPSS